MGLGRGGSNIGEVETVDGRGELGATIFLNIPPVVNRLTTIG